jgi:hypothetical protein
VTARSVLDGIKVRLSAATPGPWVAHDLSDAVYSPDDNTGWWWVWQESKLPYYGAVLEPTDRSPNDGSIGVAAVDDNRTGVQEKADAEFIAAAPTDVARLAGVLEAVLALAEEWRYKGEFGWGAWQEGQGPDPEGYVLDTAAGELRSAIENALGGDRE